jgi:hypothetical protein
MKMMSWSRYHYRPWSVVRLPRRRAVKSPKGLKKGPKKAPLDHGLPERPADRRGWPGLIFRLFRP